MSDFSTRLFEDVKPDFFRLLGYDSAFLYLDAIDAVAAAIPSRGGGLRRADALSVIEDILRINPERSSKERLRRTRPSESKAIWS